MDKYSITDAGMETIATVKQLIDLFAARRVRAEDIGVDVERVNGWAKTGSIPAKYHWQVCRAARHRGIPITAEHLDMLHNEGARE
jgi:hypothetical protein